MRGWVLSRWDGAHRIELAMDTVREKVKWYQEIAAVVSSAQSKYLYGKGFLRVRGAAAELKTKLQAIGVVCTTRFCASERKVYKSFGRNLVVLISDMEKQRLNATDKEDLLKLRGITFVVHLYGI